MTAQFSKPKQRQDAASIRAKLADYLAAKNSVIVAYLFGSYAREQATFISDVDIALLVQPSLDSDARFELRLRAADDIRSLLAIPEVDLIILNDTALALAYRVLRDGVVLFCRDEQLRIEWTASTISRYLDFKPFRDRHERAVLERARRGELLHGYHPYRQSLEHYRQLRERLAANAEPKL